MAQFKYRGRGRSLTDVRRNAKESSGIYDSYLIPDVVRYKPREGENQIRILPAPDFGDTPKGKARQAKYFDKWGKGWHIICYLHRNVGPDNGTYLCPAKMKGLECPVCEAIQESDDKDDTDEIRLQKRPFCYVLDRDNMKAGVQVWDMPMGLFRDISLRSEDRKTHEVLLIDHPEDGFDIMFTREGTDIKTKYTGVEIDRDPSPLHESRSKMQQYLEYVNNLPLPNVLNHYDPEHIEKTLMGAAKRRAEDDEEDDEEETGSRRRKKPASRKRRRSRDEDEEDEEEENGDEEEEEEDEEEEEERPRRRRRRSRDEDEEEEEDEDEEDEDEEEEDEEEEKKPARRRRRRASDEDEEDEDEEEEEEEEDEEEEEEKSSARAKRRLARLRRKK